MSNGVGQHSRLMRLLSRITPLVCLLPPVLVAQAISDIRIVTPREFGYTIGETIRHEMHLSLAGTYRLDTTTLPTSGRLNHWLEISRAEAQIEHRNNGVTYHIVVDYQIFNAPRQLTSVTIPQLEFLTTGEANSIPVFLPAWTFTIGPITPSDADEIISLRPDRKPQPIPVITRRVRLIISTLLLVGLLIYFVYRRLLLPRLERDRYPFSEALLELRKLQRRDADPEIYRRGLQTFHAAMNATAGRVVFTANLQDFLAANSKFAMLKTELVALYARSQDIFFKNAEVAESATSLQELVELCRRCRRLERSVA
ncbi:MAG: hypothetical protein OER97_05120 [Gammaproteobacteria bacterium]|nr:hypothetical protein [Gammaproteobacteria bacterium]